METYLATVLFAINYIQVIWALLLKKYINTRQSIFLSILLVSIISSSFFIRTPYNFLLLFVFYIASAIFIIRYTGSWILMFLTLFLINSLVLTSWLFTYDLLIFLFHIKYIDAAQLQMLVPFSLLGQQISLFLLISVIRKVDQNYLISDSILGIHKNYKLQSMIALFFLILFALLKQLAVRYFILESFFYLTFLLLTLNFIVYTTAYLYSKYYQEQLKKEIMFEQYNQEIEKINVSDEFRHDYRNILLSLADYIEQGETKEALAYISSITDYSKSVLEKDPYAELGNIPIPPIQGQLIYLIEECKNEQIQLRLNIPDTIQVSDLSIRLIDFLRCLSTLLDFAIKEMMTKTLDLSIIKLEKQLIFDLTNMDDSTRSLEKISGKVLNPKKYLKENNIHTAQKILNQYQRTTFFFYHDNNDFIVTFKLPLN